jgi:predicted NBD/HSP70 family sugar kinase
MFIGIDLGGTKIEGILVDSSGKIIDKKRLPTESKRSLKFTLDNLLSVIKYLSNGKIHGVGIGTPGFVVNGKLTLIKNVPNLMNYDLKHWLIKHTGCKNVEIENDANCFALAEYRFGAGKGTENMVGVIIGTGLGGGIIIKNKLYSGTIGGAGEIGHTTLVPNGEPCTCGGNGHFEAYCSGTGITRRYISAKGKIIDPNPSLIFSSKEKIAKEISDETIEYLAMGLSNLIMTLNPEMIVLGGGVSNINFYSDLNKRIKKYLNPAHYGCVNIVKNVLGDSSGVLGAAALVM